MEHGQKKDGKRGVYPKKQDQEQNPSNKGGKTLRDRNRNDKHTSHSASPPPALGQVEGPAASVIIFTDLVEGPVGVLNPEPAHDLQAVHALLLLPLLVGRSAQPATI